MVILLLTVVKDMQVDSHGLWVKFGENRATNVSIKGCKNVDDFIKAVKKELTPLLDAFSIADITLSATEGGDSLRTGLKLNELTSISDYPGSNDLNPLFISILRSESNGNFIINSS